MTSTPPRRFSKFSSFLGWSPTKDDDDRWYIPYPDNQHPERVRARVRSRTFSGTSDSTMSQQPSFFSFDPAQSIGESPRTSHISSSQHHPTHHRERPSFTSLLQFVHNSPRLPSHSPPSHSLELDQKLSPPLELPHYEVTQPLRPRAKTVSHHPAASSADSRTRTLKSSPRSEYEPPPPSHIPSLPPLANASRHPYALARSPLPFTPVSAPVFADPHRQVPPPDTEPKGLKTYSSTPNLRQKSSFARLRAKKSLNVVAETWCDALLFPRPRLRAHRLSITPPLTPMSPEPPSTLQPLDPSNPDATTSVLSQDALMRAVQAGRQRDQEKQQWNAYASASFQNARSRSLNRTRRGMHPPASQFKEGKDVTANGVKRGIEIIAESAFSQGNSASNSASGGSTASHSRNTSLVTDKSARRQNASNQRAHANQPTKGGERGLMTALSNPDLTTHLYVNLPHVQDSPTFLELAPKPPPPPDEITQLATVHGEENLDRKSESTPPSADSGIGIAMDSPETSIMSIAGHPYASPSITYSHLPPGPHPSSPHIAQYRFATSQNIALRHRLPPRVLPPASSPPPSALPLPVAPPTSLTLPNGLVATTDPPVEVYVPQQPSVNSRRTDNHVYAYSDDHDDGTILGIEEALKRAMKRTSTGSVLTTNQFPIPAPREEPPVPELPAKHRSSVTPPTRLEPVVFERAAARLSPIQDVSTPPPSRTVSVSPLKAEAATEGIDLERSSDPLPSAATSDSSPASEHGARVLTDPDDLEMYKNLFYGSLPPASPDYTTARQSTRTSVPASSSDAMDGRSLSIRNIDGLKGLRDRISEELNFWNLPSPNEMAALGDGSAVLWGSRQGGLRGSKSEKVVINLPPASEESVTAEQSPQVPLDGTPAQSRLHPQVNSFSNPNEEFPSSRASSEFGETEESLDFTIRHVENAMSLTVTSDEARPVSTHLMTIDTRSAEGEYPDNKFEFLTTSAEAVRESAYSTTTDNSRVSNIIADFPNPPVATPGSEFITPATLLESYFTAPEHESTSTQLVNGISRS